jgi:hypothetical protein
VQAVTGELLVELRQHHAGLGTHPALLLVDFEDAMHFGREVHDDRVVHGLSGEAGAAAPGHHGDTRLGCGAQDVLHVRRVGGEDNCHRLHLVERGVRGVEQAVDLVRAHLT